MEKFLARPVPSQASPRLREYLQDQISRMQVLLNGAALREEEETITGNWTFSGTLTIPQAAVTVHQSALSLAASQITSGTFANARIAQSNVTQHQGALALAASQITSGTFANARIAASNVIQHQAALSIAETQIPDGALLARVAENETISGAWTFSGNVTMNGLLTMGQEIRLQDGTVGDPSLTFASDEDTGFCWGGASVVTFVANGSDVASFGATRFQFRIPMYFQSRSAAAANLSGYGQIWVKNTSPQQLWFTDHAGNDTQIV